jgi:hypothetical protein
VAYKKGETYLHLPTNSFVDMRKKIEFVNDLAQWLYFGLAVSNLQAIGRFTEINHVQ